jgi:hypothetical protein
MQEFPIGLICFFEYFFDLLFEFGGGARRSWDEFNQITRLLQIRFDLGDVGKV